MEANGDDHLGDDTSKLGGSLTACMDELSRYLVEIGLVPEGAVSCATNGAALDSAAA